MDNDTGNMEKMDMVLVTYTSQSIKEVRRENDSDNRLRNGKSSKCEKSFE